MQEYNDGSFGDIKNAEDFSKLFDEENAGDLAKTKAIHFGTEEELGNIKNKTKGAFGNSERRSEDNSSVKEYLRNVDRKLDKIIKHFKIYDIIG